jgi:hypothetical protein
MLIAKITKSNSHVDYFARVLDSLETSANLSPSDFQFGQFVKIAVGPTEVIGVIYNSQLINPEYGNYGPRLSTPSNLNVVFSPDYLNEQGVLISILLLGWRDTDGNYQDVPRVVLPINSHVETMSDAEVRARSTTTGVTETARCRRITIRTSRSTRSSSLSNCCRP